MNEARPPDRSELERAVAVRPDPINPKIRALEVIDTDFHFTPRWETLRRYLKEPFKSRLFHYPVGSLEYNPEPANEKPGVGQDTHGVATTGAEVLAVLEQYGTDIVILNPGYNRPQSIFNEPVIAAVAAAHNDYLIEEVFPVSDRIKANLMICHRDPQMGADEIRRVGHHKQFVGVYTSFSALYEPIGNARYDPILDAMAEFDLVLTAHSEGFFPHFTPLWTGARTWIELFGNAPAGNCMAHLAAMIVQGMFDKYPKQKVIFQEGGYWWLPDFMLRLDDFYMSSAGDIALVERKIAAGERGLHRLPSEYVLEHVRFSTQPITIPKNRKHFAWMLELCHATDLFCYSSDWPHQTLDPANWVVENPDCIPDDVQKSLLSGNARKLYARLG
jgi:predicted TIM-barrel fold metal-dependent hydrolase